MGHRHDTGEDSNLDRRSVLLGGVALTASLTFTAAEIWARIARAEAPAPARRHGQLLDLVAELVIPATQTPGARAAGVPEFVALAVEHGLNGSTPGILDQVQELLDRRTGSTFLHVAPALQASTLEMVDAEAYLPAAVGTTPEAQRFAAWRVLKGLILIGYYTSEVGATQELRYDPVPGRFDADIPLDPGQPALANDWYGNTF